LCNPSNYFRETENVFGRIISANMLGLHEAVKQDICGLRQIRSPDNDWTQ